MAKIEQVVSRSSSTPVRAPQSTQARSPLCSFPNLPAIEASNQNTVLATQPPIYVTPTHSCSLSVQSPYRRGNSWPPLVSLCTNVPVDLAVTVARRRLQADSSLAEHISLSVDEVMKLLELCLSTTFMAF